jgi:hypothetical protein
MDPGELGMKITCEWEEFILQANVAWYGFQEEERRCGICKGLDGDGSNTSGIYLPNELGMFEFVEPQVFGDIEFATQPKQEERAVDYCTGGEKGEESCKELDKIRNFLKQLNNKLHLLVVSVKSNQVGIMDHLWGSITCLGSALDAFHGRVCGVEQDVGDLAEVLDKYNLVELSEGLMRNLGQVAPMASSNPQFDNLQEMIVDLTRLIALVDKDHQKAGRYLLGKLRVITPPQSQAGEGVGIPSWSPSPLRRFCGIWTLCWERVCSLAPDCSCWFVALSTSSLGNGFCVCCPSWSSCISIRCPLP